MPARLPPFEPVGLGEMRALWRRHRGEKDIERLLLEIQYGRRVIHDIEDYFESIQRVWSTEKLGKLVALEKVRLLLVGQRLRQGALQGLMPATSQQSTKRDGDDDHTDPELVDA
ncbi:hypothetical protein [Caballeronia sp. DA-9]|uniref:hypothetical protein n=1 Tax=Caballeronia sp. DA-9 TaxID=3436237 RepID=UPI003F671080